MSKYNPFLGLQWYDTFLYAALLLLSAMIPTTWQFGCFVALALLGVAAVVKAAATRTWGNRSLQRGTLVALLLMVLFWLTYLFSAFMSHNKEVAYSYVTLEMLFLVFPLIFLICDTRFLSSRRLRIAFFVFAAAMMCRFLVSRAEAVIDICHGGSPLSIITGRYDMLHHNYLSLYLLMSMAFLYSEFARPREVRLLRLPAWSLLVAIAIFAYFIMLSGSRSGAVVMALFFVAALIHAATRLHRWKEALTVLTVLVLGAGACYAFVPSTRESVEYTISEIKNGNGGDIRTKLFASGWKVFVRESPVVGIGCGDYEPLLYQQYADDGLDFSYEHQLSTHNQYLEILLANGIIGFIVMIAMLLAPLFLAFQRKCNRLLIALGTLCFCGCIYFEFAFGRQLGLMPGCWWLCLAALLSQPDGAATPAED